MDMNKDFTWIPFSSGHIALWHRPKNKTIPLLKAQGCSHVLTLLGKKENPELIGQEVNKHNIEWLLYNLDAKTLPNKEQVDEIKRLFCKIKSSLDNKAKIFIHDAADLNRVAMMIFSFFLYCGYDKDGAINKLRNIDFALYKKLNDERSKWAQQHFEVRD